MRRTFQYLALGLCGLIWAGGADGRDEVPFKKPAKAPEAESTCGDHGTSIHFEKTPSDAARRALKEEKLVFVLHISGHFEDPDFT